MRKLTVLAATAAVVGATALPASAFPLPMDVNIDVMGDGVVRIQADDKPDGDPATTASASTRPRTTTTRRPSAGIRRPGTSQAKPRKTKAQALKEVTAELKLTKPQIGSSACSTDDACTGTVGVPVWLWADEGDGQLPSASASAVAGAWDIHARTEVVKVKWSLGDGQTTVCSGTGTEYDPEVHGWSTPDCGFAEGWTEPGTYTLTATYVWRISWSGDETGTQTETMSSSREVTVGELQSVVTGH